ncbi:MAG TPA: hypothetical protein VFG42_14865 [Baekduia sp.]|uniref:hypothetical protein n=1 Tax=Baekduia sp. TaxID=2600305 RepID=UPI002D779616|nr:hypothetical protein [Baekduia sp.]HET6508070.1 hypothetical protein [Baekduia sp.]
MSRTDWARRFAAPCLAAAAFASALAPAAQAHTSEPALTHSVATAITYVKSLQDDAGNYVSTGLSNEWAFSGLAAAHVAAADIWATGDANRNARRTYRLALADPTWPSASPVATDYERATLNSYSAGIDPARVSPTRNLIANVVSTWSTSNPGYYGSPSLFNGAVFGLLALSGATTSSGARRVPQALLDKTIAVVKANQHFNGGWDFSKAEGNHANLTAAGDIDMTGAALASLCQAGVANTDAAVVAGKNYLKATYNTTTGAFNYPFGANTDSNGWAQSGLNACGFDAQGSDFTGPSGATPVDFLVGQQVSGGGFRYGTTGTTPNAYASLDAFRALAGGAFSATPPAPSVTTSEPRFVGDTTFVAGTQSKLALVVDDGSGTLKVCSVALSATGTTTLGAVLTAATTSATPSGCVSGFSPTSGTITTINGVSNAGASTWKSSLDGSSPIGADAGTTVHLGDTVSLKYGT